MANRYTLSGVYRPDEPTSGDYLRQGIGQALQTYLQRREQNREEENDLAAAGARELPKGVPVEAATLPTIDAHTPMPDVGQDVSLVPGVSIHLPSTGARASIRTTPPFAEPRYAAAGGGIGRAIGAALAPQQPTAQMPAAPQPPMARRSGIGREIGRAIGAPEPERYDNTITTTPSTLVPYRARNGKTYVVDPNYGKRVAFQEQERENEVAQSAEEARSERQQQRKIQSLVDAGMDPAEARARVLNNTVQYDTQFGRQFAPNHSLTFGERQQLEAERFTHQQELERLRGQERIAQERVKQSLAHGTASEKRQSLQALRQTLADERTSLDRQAANDWMLDPNDPNTQATLSDRAAERQRIEDATQQVEQALQQLGGVTPQQPQQSQRPQQPQQPQGGRRATINQQQYDAAIKKGYSDAEIAAHYDIDPSVRRRR